MIRRRWLIVVLTIAVAALAAYLISKSQEDKYTAETTLLLRGTAPTSADAAFAPPNPESAPDREELALSGPILERTEKRLERRLGKTGASDAVKELVVTSPAESELIRITATAPGPSAAALIANTHGSTLTAYRRDTSLAKIRKAQRVAQRELDRVGDGQTPEAAAARVKLVEQLQNLRQSVPLQDGDTDVIRRATAPPSPSSPKPNRNALIGAFAGLLLGLAIAMVREQLDRRLKQSKELEHVFGLPVLANVPKSRSLSVSNGRAMEQLPPREAEAFQMLRANLRYLNTERELRSVVVTSAGVGDGKSTVSLNLAKAEALVGRKVLLIESDVRRPRLAGLLGVHDNIGLASYLAKPDLTLAEVSHRVPVAQNTNGTTRALTMDVVVAGDVPSNPSELINSERMRELISEAEENYDLVVIDTSPAGMVADPIPLMSQATAVVVVGRVGRITSGEAQALREQLERIDAPAYGLVANFSAGAGEGSYGYY